MDTKLIGAALVGLIIGALGTMLVTKNDNDMPIEGSHMMESGEIMADDAMGGMYGAMGDMMAGLEGKTGDAFDEAFLSEMIVHHEGAVSMAEAALRNAKHTELKQMAEAIISAQTTEIAQMKEWQKSWYGVE
jgi:uncharacterized protein (DUF305 family)